MFPDGFSAATRATLDGVAAESDAIDAVVKLIDQIATEMKNGDIPVVPSNGFGGSSHGGLLATHNEKARQVVHAALDDLYTGLTEYATIIKTYQRDVTRTDEDVAAENKRLLAATEAVSTPLDYGYVKPTESAVAPSLADTPTPAPGAPADLPSAEAPVAPEAPARPEDPSRGGQA